MTQTYTPNIDQRLQRRYTSLVQGHMHTGSRTAAGISLPQGSRKAFTATQGAWRFFNNGAVTLTALVEPLRKVGTEAASNSPSSFALLVHDWSKLGYGAHRSKKDVAQLTHQYDKGYELTTSLLVSADDGYPLAPMEFHVKANKRVYSTRPDVLPSNHLNQVLPTMEASKDWKVPRILVHVIDREADSIRHLRAWHGAGHLFLIRVDDRIVRWNDADWHIADIAKQLAFTKHQDVTYRQKKGRLQVAETTVTLHRAAKPKNHPQVPGEPLTARLVVSRIVSKRGEILAQWFLLTTVPIIEAEASIIARWYYWRWKIETFFKLLKSSGLELEYWQQETALAISRRLLVAAMACVTVWQLERDTTEAAERMKLLLMRLSGRATKRSRPVTAPGLLHGLFVLLPMLDFMREDRMDAVQALAFETIPFLKAAYDV